MLELYKKNLLKLTTGVKFWLVIWSWNQKMYILKISSIQSEDIMKFCPIEYFWTLMYRDFLSSKNQTKKITKFMKQTVLVFPKRFETFWFGDTTYTGNIRKNCLKHFRVYILAHFYQNQKTKSSLHFQI